MKITLIVVGKTSFDYIKAGVAEYESRIKHYIGFEIKVLQDVKNAKSLSVEQIKLKEGEIILSQLRDDDDVILLDDKGKDFTSESFAQLIENKMIQNAKNLAFIVGGAYGFSKQVYDRANNKLSLSKMTFSHQIVRLIFAEQLYRAFTIIKREPYHHS